MEDGRLLTVNILHHVDAQPVAGDGHEDLPGTLPPGQVIGGAPRGYCTEQELQVILLGQLLRRRNETAELY